MLNIEYCPSEYAHHVLINGRILAPEETPQEMFERVVETLFSVEQKFGTPPEEAEAAKLTFAKYMAEKTFTPGTPTLTNAGRPGYENSALCSCALIPVDLRKKEESTQIITAYYHQNMGSGFDLTPYSDPLFYLLWLNSLSVSATSTGEYDRYIGNMANLHVAHPRIMEFINAKRHHDLKHFNLSVIVDDAFMDAAMINEDYQQADGNIVNARALLTAMAESAWETGDPSILNLERMNAYNPLPKLAPYLAAPPCSEMGLSNGETCQFAYIDIAKFLTPSGIDYAKLAQVTKIVTRALDNAVELGLDNLPHPESKKIALLKRKIGIAASGFADTFLYYDLPYDSDGARTLARNVLSFINYTSKVASVDLAQKRGSCEAMIDKEDNRYLQDYLESRYSQGSETVSPEQWRALAAEIRETRSLRNIMTTTLPPAARVSILMDTSFGIEPIFNVPTTVASFRQSVVYFVRRHFQNPDQILQQAVTEGTFQTLNLPQGLKECLKTAKEISPSGHLHMVAGMVGRNAVVDESASKTVNLPSNATVPQIVDIFLQAHELGLKNIAVYRDGTYEDQPHKL